MSGWVWFEEHVKTAILVRLTDHSSKSPSPILRLHRCGFIRRRNRGKINTNANESVNGYAEPLSQRSLRLQSSSSPHIEWLMGILLLFRRTRLFPRRNRHVGTLPRKRWVVLSPNSSKMLPPLSLFQSRSVFNRIFRFRQQVKPSQENSPEHEVRNRNIPRSSPSPPSSTSEPCSSAASTCGAASCSPFSSASTPSSFPPHLTVRGKLFARVKVGPSSSSLIQGFSPR